MDVHPDALSSNASLEHLVGHSRSGGHQHLMHANALEFCGRAVYGQTAGR